MANHTNRDNSEMRALAALEAIEQERRAREDSAVRAMSALRELEERQRTRLARGTGAQLAATDEPPVERLGRAAEEAVERYAAAEAALQQYGVDDDSAGAYAAAEENLARLLHEAEEAVLALESAQKAEAERAAAEAAKPIPLSDTVWPAAAADPEPVIDVASYEKSVRRSARRKLLAVVVMAATAVGAIVWMQMAMTPRTVPDAEPEVAAPAPAAAPAAEPELTAAEKARREWEATQAARAAEAAKRKKAPSKRRAETIDLDAKVKVDCDPNDPLCGVSR